MTLVSNLKAWSKVIPSGVIIDVVRWEIPELNGCLYLEHQLRICWTFNCHVFLVGGLDDLIKTQISYMGCHPSH